MKPLNKSIAIPAALLVYLGAMAYMAWPSYRSGVIAGWQYFGTLAVTLAVIVVLHFVIKKRDRLRRSRQSDSKKP